MIRKGGRPLFDRKAAKASAKKIMKRNYWIFLISCLVASFLGIEYVFSLGPINTVVIEETPSIVNDIKDGRIPFDSVQFSRYRAFTVFKEVLLGNTDKGKILSDRIRNDMQNGDDIYLRSIEIGHRDGVFAEIANSISSGSPFITVYEAICSIVGNKNAASVIFIIISLLVILLIWALFVNTYRAIYRRIFLEGYIYDKVPLKTFMHFIRVKRFSKVVLSMLYITCLKLLWALTIIGGVIKYFSYFLVPYIVAENPDISPVKAKNLSRRMMHGHKFECLKIKLSFIGWYLLEFITLGVTGIFFSNPYQETVILEFYVHLRQLAKENNIEDSELLNDEYLYKKMEKEELCKLYANKTELEDTPRPNKAPGNALWRFLTNTFGVVPYYNQAEQEYFDSQLKRSKAMSIRKIIDGKIYPDRANPVPEKQKEHRVEYISFMRHYSITSLIILFLIFSFAGWFWEVLFHLVSEGRFVNRGVLHGPWIPIYGAGGIIMLLLLYKIRSRPVIHFLVSVVICGIMEYFIGRVLECIHGERWWDYSGYFLNINGLVCAEGLLMFGILGIAVVYFAAPFIDNVLRKIDKRIVVPICVIFTLVFTADAIFSISNPNKGAGINDFPAREYENDIQHKDNNEAPIPYPIVSETHQKTTSK